MKKPLKKESFMSNFVTKIIPYEPFESDLIEAWLDDLATKGLILHGITLMFARFQKTSPTPTRFRLDAAFKAEQIPIRRAFLAENGWQYVSNYLNLYHIYKTDEPFLSELPTDGAEKNSSVVWGTLAIPLGSFLFSFYFLFSLSEHLVGKPYLLYTLLQGETFTLLLIQLLLGLSFLLLGAVQLFALQKRKQREHRKIPRCKVRHMVARQAVQIGAKIVLPAITFLVLFGMQFGFQVHGYVWVQDYKGSIHFPLLEEINPEEGHALSNIASSNELISQYSVDNSIAKGHGILAPELIRLRQSGPTIQVNDTTYRSLYTYTVCYYHMLNRTLAKQLVKELSQMLGTHQMLSKNPEIHAWYSAKSEGQSLLLQHDAIVLEVWYRGAADLRDLLPLYEKDLGMKQTN
jgi:hypothetical protein